MVNDPISDFITRLRNGMMARKKDVVTNCSKMSRRIGEILERSGYIGASSYESDGARKLMRVKLRYDSAGRPITTGFKRVSRPGLRVYTSASDIPEVRGGMGIAILSTPKGVMTGVEAKKQNVGGEVLCLVW